MVDVSSNSIESQVPRVYNLSLLMAFVANVFQLISVSLLFRYSDFVYSHDGTEWHLGWIVGIGSVGAVAFRLYQGMAVDWLGPELIWIASIIGQIISLWWHLNIDSISSIEVYLARTLYATSLSGAFGAWLSFISLQAPIQRVAEVIGVVGSSGFVGMAVGPAIGDWIFELFEGEAQQVSALFVLSNVMVVVALLAALLACRLGRDHALLRETRVGRKKENPVTVVWKTNPGFILIVGMTMGMTIGFPATYMRPLAESLNIDRIMLFFLVYNIAAFVSRLSFRHAPQVLGLRNTILTGFGFMALSMLLYLPLKNESGLWLPALAGGIAHSFLFPSVIAACTNQFPEHQRGVSTNLILAMYDLGFLIGMPAIGIILTTARHYGWSPYPLAVEAIFLTILIVAGVFSTRRI